MPRRGFTQKTITMKKQILQLIIPVRNDNDSDSKAKEAKKYYEELGFEVWDPHEIANNIQAEEAYTLRTEAKIQSTCLFMLAEADLAVVMPGWKTSEGCRNEIHFASRHDIPLYLHSNGKRSYFYTNVEATYEHIVDNDTIENMISETKEA